MMFTRIKDFDEIWSAHVEDTKKILSALTDKSLSQPITDQHRTLGRIAWHIVRTLPWMAAEFGVQIDCGAQGDKVPPSAAEIIRTYGSCAEAVRKFVTAQWTDADLECVDEMFGEKWKRGYSLMALITHEVHHRGQMMVLMRQAGLKVPGVFGPSKEEWSAYGMEEPAL
jgi:uncharacterized damage-inducible protein DinB